MYIVIGADLVPTESNIELFMAGDKISLVGNELEKILDNASYRVFNLEVPLADHEKPITKQGPNLIAPTETVEGYKALGVDLLTLANNHIMDQDEQGLRSTINALDGVGIKHVGAGKDITDASAPFIFTFVGRKIGVYACAEHEFSIAEADKPGANPFDPLYSLDHVEKLKRESDYVIVLYHGGKEHYRYPSPMLQNICRRFIDKGANLVICQHSHCIGCEEQYQNGTIIYGQGNFLFDHSNDECWKTSLLIKVDEDYCVSYVPLVKDGNCVCLAEETMARKILNDFNFRSKEIKRIGFVEEKYIELAHKYLDFYLQALSGKRSVIFRIINKLSGNRLWKHFLQKSYKRGNKVRIANYIDCEAHRELLSQALADYYK